jgi:hypothetical protein
MATNGTDIGFAYNSSAGMEFYFTDMSGNQVYAPAPYCTSSGGGQTFYNCSDPTLLYDGQANKWLFSYLAYNAYLNGRFMEGASIVVAASKHSDPSLGFWNPVLVGTVTDGCLDQPRLAFTTDMVVVTANYWNWASTNSCDTVNYNNTGDDVVAINKTQLYAGAIPDRVMNRFTNMSLQPTPTPSYEGTILWESPDWATGSHHGVQAFITGPESDVNFQWFTLPVTSYNMSPAFYASQPNTSVELDLDDGRFTSAAFSGNTAWAVANQPCTNNQFCPFFYIVNVDASGKPTTYVNSFNLQNSSGWNMYYVAIATTIGSSSVIGVLDYTYVSGGIDPSSEGFQISTAGSYAASGSEVGTTTIPVDDGNGHARYGDYSGCDYVAGTYVAGVSPAQVACVGQFAQNNPGSFNQALEEYTNKFS